MGKGGEVVEHSGKSFDWNEIKKHTSANDKWLVIDGEVYDISRWLYKHPGGRRVIGHYAGQDATVSVHVSNQSHDCIICMCIIPRDGVNYYYNTIYYYFISMYYYYCYISIYYTLEI